MVSGINNAEQSIFQPQFRQREIFTQDTLEPLNSFAQEDQAIVSAEAKLLYELEEFNAGGDNFVELAAANVMTKFVVSAEVNVIDTKKDMLDIILGMSD